MTTWAWDPRIIRKRIAHFENLIMHSKGREKSSAKFYLRRWQQRLRDAEAKIAGGVKVERDTAPDADEYGGWRVTVETDQSWLVKFRGDIAECEDMAAQEKSDEESSD